MSRIQILQVANLPKNLVLTGKGVSRKKRAGNYLFDVCPIESPHKLGQNPDSPAPTSVEVFAGLESEPKPQLDLNGVYQVETLPNGTPITQTVGAHTLYILKKVEFVRNKGV
jgi:hypothetical protein